MLKIKKILYYLTPDLFYFKYKGFCPICERETIFLTKKTWLRDNLLCINCGSIPRQRAIMTIINNYYPNWKDLKIHESSPSNCSISNKLKRECNGYTGTQYYHGEILGNYVNEYRNENLENQTFNDEMFDLVITQDVFEHIYNPDKAFSEIERTLKYGGAHIFTVPIINKFKKTEKWAILGSDGKPIFLKTEEWHGNPVDVRGSPVTMHYGYDIIDYIKENSGLETNIEYIHDLKFGIWAEFNEVFISKKGYF